MRKIYSFTLAIGITLVLLAVLCKEFHWQYRKPFEVAGIICLLFAILIYLFALIRGKKSF